MIIAAIDPGKKVCGVSLIRHGVLDRFALIRVMDRERLRDAERVAALAARCAEALAGSEIDHLIVESQQIYHGSRENPNDLLPVAHTAGACLVAVSATRKTLVKPRDWTVGVPKDVRIERAKKAAACGQGLLSAKIASRIEGITPRSLRHNVWDAVLLNVWAWDRRQHL